MKTKIMQRKRKIERLHRLHQERSGGRNVDKILITKSHTIIEIMTQSLSGMKMCE